MINLEDAASLSFLKSHANVLSRPEMRGRILVGNLPSGKEAHLFVFVVVMVSERGPSLYEDVLLHVLYFGFVAVGPPFVCLGDFSLVCCRPVQRRAELRELPFPLLLFQRNSKTTLFREFPVLAWVFSCVFPQTVGFMRHLFHLSWPMFCAFVSVLFLLVPAKSLSLRVCVVLCCHLTSVSVSFLLQVSRCCFEKYSTTSLF